MGLIFFGDKNHFVDVKEKNFILDLIVEFLQEKGIGYYDTAEAVKRLKDNASDKFLEIVEYTDINAILDNIFSFPIYTCHSNVCMVPQSM